MLLLPLIQMPKSVVTASGAENVDHAVPLYRMTNPPVPVAYTSLAETPYRDSSVAPPGAVVCNDHVVPL